MTLSPVQVLVVGFDELNPTGEAIAELSRLEAAGVVRLVDLMLVQRSEDGALETVDLDDGVEPVPGSIAARFFSASGSDPSEADQTWSLLDAVPVGGVAAVALIEHLWAGPLRAAIGRSGGRPLEETWLAAEDLAVLEALLPG
jgi:hypothetical protein